VHRGWLKWLLGLALLGAVVLVVVHASEGRDLVRLARQAQPRWLLVALVLQSATYPFQGEVWQTALRPAGPRIGGAAMARLTFARLAIDHTLPAAGLGGTVLAAKALQQQDVPLPVVMAGVVIDTASLYATYACGLAAALVILVARYDAPAFIVVGAITFLACALALAIGFLSIAGRPAGPFARRLGRLRPLDVGLRLIEQADRRLARSPLLLARASICQAAVVLLDAATMWALIAAVGARAAPAGVFASFMLSTLLRLAGAVPGGLGTFDAASVLTLRLMGVELPVALSATLLFRGVAFWLPLAPGLWFARRYAVTKT
jgi:Mg2+-importing ATPase